MARTKPPPRKSTGACFIEFNKALRLGDRIAAEYALRPCLRIHYIGIDTWQTIFDKHDFEFLSAVSYNVEYQRYGAREYRENFLQTAVRVATPELVTLITKSYNHLVSITDREYRENLLQTAVRVARPELVTLIAKEYNHLVSITDREGNGAFHWACIGGRYTSVIGMLPSSGKEVWRRNNNGVLPIQQLVQAFEKKTRSRGQKYADVKGKKYVTALYQMLKHSPDYLATLI